MPKRIGIFGGTFDPPHLGHLILASEARTQLRLDRVLWVITPLSPHKVGNFITDIQPRLEMVRLAIAEEPDFEPSTIEFDRPAPQYTVDTVKIIQAQQPNADLILLLGADSLRGIVTWHRPSDLVAACHEIGVMRRPSESIQIATLKAVLPAVEHKIRYIETPLLEISSREIRHRIMDGLQFRYFLPPAVYDYIQANGLYRG